MKSIFISSTFRDMQTERDVLMTSVVPELSDFARAFGENIRFVDLRWGVNTSELESDAGSEKVLSVCLDEIDRTRPYIIVLVGERYGWVPDEALIARTASEKNLSLYDFAKSVTELEIEYGVFAKENALDRCLFYFREPLCDVPDAQRHIYMEQTPALFQKLENLKAKIRASGATIKTYACTWNDKTQALACSAQFAPMVCADVKALFANEFAKSKTRTWQEQEVLSAKAFADYKAEQFSARYDLLQKYTEQILAKNLFVLQGASGTGKSTFMAKLAKDMSCEARVSFFACGNGARSQTALDILRQMVYQFEQYLGITEHFGAQDKENAIDVADWVEKLEEYTAAYHKNVGEPYCIFIDALDQLAQDELRDKMRFLPEQLPASVHVVISCLSSFTLPIIYPLQTNSVCVQVLPLAEEEKPMVVQGILRHMGKEITPALIKAIVAVPQANNPLYLSLLLQRLFMLDSKDFGIIARYGNDMDAINRYLLEVIETTPDNAEDMAVEVLREASERINETLCKQAVLLIANARRGLRESDLASIFSSRGQVWQSLDFSRLRKYMQAFFLERDDGRIDFTHATFRTGFLTAAQQLPLQQEILQHLKTLPQADIVRQEEITWCAYQADDKAFLAQYIDLLEAGVDADDSKRAECEKALQWCAKTMRDIATQDLAWVKQWSQETITQKNVQNLTYFFGSELDDAWAQSRKEQQIKVELLEFLVPVLQALYPESEREQSTDLCYEWGILDRLADSYHLLENFAASLAWAQKHHVLIMRNAQQRDTVKAWNHVANSFISLGKAHRVLKQYAKALEMFEQSKAVSERSLAKEETVETQRDFALALGYVGDEKKRAKEYTQAFSCYEKSNAMFEQLAQKNDDWWDWRNLDGGLQMLSTLQRSMKQYGQAIETSTKSVEIAQRLAQQYNTTRTWEMLSDALWNLGVAYDKIENTTKKGECFERCLQIEERLATDLDTPRSWRSYARVLQKVGEMLWSQDYYAKAIEIRKRLAHEQNTLSAWRALDVALGKSRSLHEFFRHNEQNRDVLLEIKQVREQLVQMTDERNDWRNLLNTLTLLGNVHNQLDALQQAVAYFEQAQELCERLIDEKDTPEVQRSLSLCYRWHAPVQQKLGEEWHALALLERANGINERLVKRCDRLKDWEELCRGLKALIPQQQSMGHV